MVDVVEMYEKNPEGPLLYLRPRDNKCVLDNLLLMLLVNFQCPWLTRDLASTSKQSYTIIKNTLGV